MPLIIPKENYRSIHVKANITLVINTVVVMSGQYFSKKHRQEIIDNWRLLFPPRQNQIREIIITPNWKDWNGYVGDPYDEIKEKPPTIK